MANPRQNQAQKDSAAKKNTSRPETATREELRKRILSLTTELEKANERAKSDNSITSATAEATANRLANDIIRLENRLSAMGGSVPTPKNRPASKYRGEVKPAPGSKLEDKGPARSKPPVPKNRPSTVDTKPKKSIIDRLMSELSDPRNAERARELREANREDAMKTMGRKKGGMAKKKKAPVKKAYGGMVKKKQGGSANKVNMKAGFTRRGCSKG